MERVRAFIAVDMPPTVADAVKRCRAVLEKKVSGVKWTKPENVHLTLRFLGEVPKEEIRKIGEAAFIVAKNSEGLRLQAEGGGIFPERGFPRVIWMGLQGEIDLLLSIRRKIDAALNEIGFPKEKRPFRGHLTIGRVKGRADAGLLRRELQLIENIQSETFTARRIALFKSDLKPGGAVYTPLVSAELGKSR